MHSGRRFNLKQALIWTRREIYWFFIIATIPTLVYHFLHWKWMAIPWLPVALVGTAVAFLIGFKNNATYDRMWEARKIWGAIVNSSRIWGIMVKDFITDMHAKKPIADKELFKIKQKLIYRHIAWLTALRFQLREEKEWENLKRPHNQEFRRFYHIPEHESRLEEEMALVLPLEEVKEFCGYKNKATQILSKQSEHLKALLYAGLIEDFRHMELQNLLANFYEHQGKSERIKNFPFPRHFATINHYFVWLFVCLLPFGMLQEFDELGRSFVWLTIPFSVLVSWVFHTIEKIGEATENPFEGTANDVPITGLSRTIEIDLREMLGEKNLPNPIKAYNEILM